MLESIVSPSFLPLASIVKLRRNRSTNLLNSMLKVFCNSTPRTRFDRDWSKPCLVKTSDLHPCSTNLISYPCMGFCLGIPSQMGFMNDKIFASHTTLVGLQRSMLIEPQMHCLGLLLKAKSNGLRKNSGPSLQTMLLIQFSRHLTYGLNQQ